MQFGELTLEQWCQSLSPVKPAAGATGISSTDKTDATINDSSQNGISRPVTKHRQPTTPAAGLSSPGASIVKSPTSLTSGSSPVLPSSAVPFSGMSWAQRVANSGPPQQPRTPTYVVSSKTPSPLPMLKRLSPPAPLPPRRVRGLINAGNTCFINVILQALIACDDFRRFLLESQDKKSNPDLINHFVQLASDMTLPEGVKRQSVRDTKTVPNLAENLLPEWAHEVFPSFSPTPVANGDTSRRVQISQEDAQEFLSYLLNRLHEELLAGRKQLIPNGTSHIADDDGGEWQEMSRRGRTVQVRGSTSSPSAITRIFGGNMRSELKRPRAPASVTREPYLHLSLDIESGMIRNVDEALNDFFRAERLEGYTTEGSSETVEARKQTTLESLPPVLILHLKRFSHDQRTGLSTKLGHRCDFSETLTIPASALYTPMHSSDRKYRLTSVVVHQGKHVANGHYVADVRVPTSERDIWIQCDDSQISQVNLQTVLRRQAYLLFYTRMHEGD